MKRIFLFGVLLALLNIQSAVYARDKSMLSKNSIAVKSGPYFFQDDSFLDKWGLDSETYTYEVSYEKVINKFLAFEIAIGFHTIDSHLSHQFLNYELDIKNYYLSPTIKYFPHKTKYTAIYLGTGPDIYKSDFEGNGNLESYGIDSNFEENIYCLGLHGLLGAELLIFRNPRKYNYFNSPVGLFIEYKYTWADFKDYDQEPVKKMNIFIKNYNNQVTWQQLKKRKSDNFNTGGHSIVLGLRWHF